jgi:hypothetical protein
MLSDAKIKTAKPGDKPFRTFDGGCLYLEITPTGGKPWRLKYRFGGKEKRLALGTYPDTPLAKARMQRDEERRLLADGIGPSENRKIQKAAKVAQAEEPFAAHCLRRHPDTSPRLLNRLTWANCSAPSTDSRARSSCSAL